MTDKPNIAALRIDERLVHGQGQLWIKTLGVNTVIVANDEAANDPIQQTLMKTVIPKTIAMRFFTVQHTCDVIYKASPKQGSMWEISTEHRENRRSAHTLHLGKKTGMRSEL